MPRRSGRRQVAAGLFVAAARAQSAPAQLKLAKGLRDLNEATLRFFRQLGVEHVVMPSRYREEVTKRPLVPATQRGPQPGQLLGRWDKVELTRVKERVEAFGLHPGMLHLGNPTRVYLGHSEAEQEIENAKANIRLAGELGIPVVEYNAYGLRASEGYARVEAPNGMGLRDFDSERVRDLPPLDNVGEHSREAIWERLVALLGELCPVAEDAGVRLALHPNDPPLEVFRGVGQPVRSLADQRRLIEAVPSPANGITLDTGVTTEMGEDAAEAIRYFGSRDRIHHVHFRNVRVERPYEKYTEVPHPRGDANLLACMRAFAKVRYPYLIIPDHTPAFSNDNTASQMGWAYALGYLRGLEKGV